LAGGQATKSVVTGPVAELQSQNLILKLRLKARACGALNVNDRYNMQDSNHWYSLQRSNTDPNAYSIQNPASNTPTLASAGPHDNQVLPSLYSFASAVRPTQGEIF
jgi:hypothetical protein